MTTCPKPCLWPAPRAAYVALIVLIEPRELLACGRLRLEAPMHPPVVLEVQGASNLGSHVLITEDDPRGAGRRRPQALLAMDPGDQLVLPLRLWLAGQRFNLQRETPGMDRQEARRVCETAMDALCTYLTFLVVWLYHPEGEDPCRAWRQAAADNAVDERNTGV